MKRIIFFCAMSLILGHSWAQYNPFIQQKGIYGGMLSENGILYAWGNNGNIVSGYGALGTGNTSSFVPTPEAVVFPEPVDIKEFSVGTAGTFLALDCEGHVWAWGTNTRGQLGNGTSDGEDGFVSTPAKVTSGMLTGTSFDDDGYLTNVSHVHAAGVASFAILSDGRLVSWGGNGAGPIVFQDAFGILGDGTEDDSYTPVFVLDGVTQSPLEHVIQLASTDNCAYALVDSLGDGYGTMYSWGNGRNGTLARDQDGEENPDGASDVESSFAYPVLNRDHTPLMGIVEIGAGAVFGMGLDKEGYIWSWGNGGWNNSTGNSQLNVTSSVPQRVLAGEADSIDTDGKYLQALHISGGLSGGSAITKSGRLVTWGGSGDCLGGYLGNGTSTSNSSAQYVVTDTDEPIEDVFLISAGYSGGMFMTKDLLWYGWGCSENGELANGSTDTEISAISIPFPSAASIPNPVPLIYPSFPSRDLCDQETETIQLRTNIPVDLADSYVMKWYLNDVLKQEAPPTGSIEEFVAVEAGEIRAVLELVGGQSACIDIPASVWNHSLVQIPPAFDITKGLYCANEANVTLESNLDGNVVYQWYNDAQNTLPSGTFTPGEAAILDISGNEDKSIKVETIVSEEFELFPKNAACDTNFGTLHKIDGITYRQQQSILKVDEEVLLKSFTFTTSMYILQENTTAAGEFLLGIYDVDYTEDRGFPEIRSSSDLLVATASVPFSISRTDSETDYTFESTVIFNEVIPPGNYIISLQPDAIDWDTDPVTTMLHSGYCFENYPVSDSSSTRDKVSLIGRGINWTNIQNQSSGSFYNFEFIQDVPYCSAKDIELTKRTKIMDFTGSQEVCENDVVVMEVSANGANATYQWYKEDSLLLEGGAKIFKITVTPFTEGSYHVVMNDDCGTEHSDTSEILVFEPQLSANDIIIDNNQLIGPEGAASYTWLFGGNVAPGIRDERIYNFTQSGFYSLIITEGPGCIQIGSEIPVVITGGLETNESQLSIYPIPTREHLHIHSESVLHFIALINEQGQQVFHQNGMNHTNLTLEIDHLSPGMYILQIQTSEGWVQKKVHLLP